MLLFAAVTVLSSVKFAVITCIWILSFDSGFVFELRRITILSFGPSAKQVVRLNKRCEQPVRLKSNYKREEKVC